MVRELFQGLGCSYFDQSLSALKASAEEQGCLLREPSRDVGKHTKSFGIFYWKDLEDHEHTGGQNQLAQHDKSTILSPRAPWQEGAHSVYPTWCTKALDFLVPCSIPVPGGFCSCMLDAVRCKKLWHNQAVLVVSHLAQQPLVHSSGKPVTTMLWFSCYTSPCCHPSLCMPDFWLM